MKIHDLWVFRFIIKSSTIALNKLIEVWPCMCFGDLMSTVRVLGFKLEILSQMVTVSSYLHVNVLTKAPRTKPFKKFWI